MNQALAAHSTERITPIVPLLALHGQIFARELIFVAGTVPKLYSGEQKD
jgi:hypothetical protein